MSHKHGLIIFIGAALLLAFWWQGSRDIWEPDEGRYAETAREMIETGNWITPQLDYHPHLTKPPLTYWVIASGMLLFGENEWGARFFHAVIFALTAFMVAGIAKQLSKGNSAFGLFAGWIYLLSPLPFGAANIVTTDAILAAWETAAALCFILLYMTESSVARQRLLRLGMWASFGLAFLTKGPAGLLPLLAFVVWAYWFRGGIRGLRRMICIPSFLLFVLLSFWWFVYLVLKNSDAFNYFFYYEFVGRIFSNIHQRETSRFILLGALLGGSLPFFAIAFYRWWKVFRRNKAELWRLVRTQLPDDGFALVLLWLTLPFIVFCLARSRLPLYVLPLSVPLTIVIALFLRDYNPFAAMNENAAFTVPGSHKVRNFVIIWLVLLLGLKTGAAYMSPSKETKPLAQTVRTYLHDDKTVICIMQSNYLSGLQFYLKRDILYTAFEDADVGAITDCKITELIERLKEPGTPDGAVIIVRFNKVDWLLSLLPPEAKLETMLPHYGIVTYRVPGT